MSAALEPFSLQKMESAVEKVHQRLLRATAALERSGVAYAVAGGNAVAAWVRRADEAAVRNTQDVDILLRRSDLAAAQSALQSAGFVYRHVAGMDIFLDGGNSSARSAVHVIFAGEKVHPHEALPNPDVTETEQADNYMILSLEALVQIKLTAWRRKDQVHLGDLLDVGLIDQTWTTRYPPELAARLQLLIDTPDG
jgi:hypothetical protein